MDIFEDRDMFFLATDIEDTSKIVINEVRMENFRSAYDLLEMLDKRTDRLRKAIEKEMEARELT